MNCEQDNKEEYPSGNRYENVVDYRSGKKFMGFFVHGGELIH